MDYLEIEQVPDNWKAKWIWKDCEIRVNDFACFRKEFEVENDIRSTRVYVSAHNHFKLFINGVEVSGYVTPAPTHPEKSKYYLCYDITRQMKTGRNAFGAVAHFLGGGGQNYVNGLPGFILQCHITYMCGMEKIILTDETWKALGDTPYRNNTEFQQSREISAIEDYDARKDEEGWFECGFDDAHWGSACLSSVNDDSWVLKPQQIPEGKVYEVIMPMAVGIQEKGMQVFDAGKIVTGWARLELSGVEGIKIMLRYSEDMDASGRVRHNVCNEKSENYFDLYTMRGRGIETWEPNFSYKAFRYVEVTGYPEVIRSENLKIVSAGTGLSYRGFFNSSNQLLNDIYHACIQTQKNNVTGQMVDCPHREQAQYLADSDLQAETFIYNFTDFSVLEKVLLDFKDAQKEDGTFPFVFPTNVDNPAFDIRIPEWDLHYVTMLWKLYFMYDNMDILSKCYETAKSAINYYLGLRDATGLVLKTQTMDLTNGGTRNWNISDWPYPNIDHSGKYLTIESCLVFHTACIMSRIAHLLGRDEDSALFDKKAGELKESILQHLYRPDKKAFADSYHSEQCCKRTNAEKSCKGTNTEQICKETDAEQTCKGSDAEQSHQGTNTVACQFGLVPEKDRPAVLESIAADGFGCSTLLTLNLLQLLFENGKGKEAYSLLNSTSSPGWGYMIKKGYKTIWEGFKDIESHSHAWNAYPARIFMEYLVGIKAAAPGFKKIDIRPYIPEDMTYAEARVPTVMGDIYARWDVDGEYLTMKVEIPAGTSARIFVNDKSFSVKAGEHEAAKCTFIVEMKR